MDYCICHRGRGGNIGLMSCCFYASEISLARNRFCCHLKRFYTVNENNRTATHGNSSDLRNNDKRISETRLSINQSLDLYEGVVVHQLD